VYRYSPLRGILLTVAATDRFGRRVVKTVAFNVLITAPKNIWHLKQKKEKPRRYLRKKIKKTAPL
jgi:hypothetical protein